MSELRGDARQNIGDCFDSVSVLGQSGRISVNRSLVFSVHESVCQGCLSAHSNVMKAHHAWHIVLLLLLFAYTVHGVLLVYRSPINADEGWYLHAASLVMDGELPYRDFAFTQTPLLPYVYGPFQGIFGNSLILGRWTTFAMSSIGMLLWLLVCLKAHGPKQGCLLIAMWTSFGYGLFNNTITKTYGFTTLVVASIAFVIFLEFDETRRVRRTLFLTSLGSLARLSFVGFQVPVLFALVKRRDKESIRFAVTIFSVLSFLLAVLILQNTDGAYWGLIGHHSMQWGDAGASEKFLTIFFERLPSLFYAFPLYTIAFGLIGLQLLRKPREGHVAQMSAALWLGLLGLACVNLISGGFYPEYYVPLVFSLIGLLSMQQLDRTRWSNAIAVVIVMAGSPLSLTRWNPLFKEAPSPSEFTSYVETCRDAAKKESKPDSRVIALEALWVVHEAELKVAEGLSMAQFSVWDGDTDESKRIRILNTELLVEAMQDESVSLVVLTSYDKVYLGNLGAWASVNETLVREYELARRVGQVDKPGNGIEFYCRRPSPERSDSHEATD